MKKSSNWNERPLTVNFSAVSDQPDPFFSPQVAQFTKLGNVFILPEGLTSTITAS